MDFYGDNGSWLYEYVCGQTPTSIGVVPRRLGRSKNQLSLGQNVLSLRLLKFEGIGILFAIILCCGGVYQVSIRLGTLSTQKRRRRGSRAMCLSGS
jgi:hypothetical protein